ncbi:hypothetical protein [Mesorhizobium sp.]|uniref:hypothetical protein n=1 Tax=Mesorhizobium sp. TaxID=1871066 RepID=UPI000FE680AE|nr:hypothetical protein [Mesorhizobium sp.]RWD73846.1 MAG: hypothetical protein EOS37_04520 [Mesorhizobium sp.]TIV59185.1 MAG: hypothetical protein E5V80_15025 [Mesorhizobium sp.]
MLMGKAPLVLVAPNHRSGPLFPKGPRFHDVKNRPAVAGRISGWIRLGAEGAWTTNQAASAATLPLSPMTATNLVSGQSFDEFFRRTGQKHHLLL